MFIKGNIDTIVAYKRREGPIDRIRNIKKWAEKIIRHIVAVFAYAKLVSKAAKTILWQAKHRQGEGL